MIIIANLGEDILGTYESSWDWGGGWFHTTQDADGITVMSRVNLIVMATIWVNDLSRLDRYSDFVRIT